MFGIGGSRETTHNTPPPTHTFTHSHTHSLTLSHTHTHSLTHTHSMTHYYPWMSYAAAHAHEAEAARLRVSAVARSAKGFMREYESAGSARAMAARPLPSGVRGGATWEQKRNGFVARHLAAYRAHPTHRRYLALLMWAYRPPPPPRRASRRAAS